jgi:hypothetical protein
MATILNRQVTFSTNGTVTAAGLHNLIDETEIYAGIITTQPVIASVGSSDQLLIADADLTPTSAPRRVTVGSMFNDALNNGIYTSSSFTGTLTAGSFVGPLNGSVNGTIVSTAGTIATLNSTTGTIATLNSTTGTIQTIVATTLITTGTGTAAAPAIVPTGDTNTGLFFPSADTIAFSEGGTESMRIDSSGKVLIGTTSNDTGGRLEVKQASSETGIGIQSSGTDDSKLYFRTASGTYGGDISWNGAYVKFSNGTTERMRIDSSGNVGIGTTSPDAKLAIDAPGGSTPTAPISCNATSGAGDRYAALFRYSGTLSGSVTVNGAAAAYNTSSDYRLKTNLEPISNGIERIKQLPVYRFNWKTNENGNKVDGFVAHEVTPIVREAIHGEKDAVDSDGNPIYQGIDQSKIVPLLTAALKEAIAKIETLEAKITALEAA